MDREQKLIQERDRAHRAKSLLDNVLLQEALTEVHQGLHAKWEGSRDGDHEGRERIWQMLLALRLVKTALEKHVNTGKLSDKELGGIIEGRQSKQPATRQP